MNRAKKLVAALLAGFCSLLIGLAPAEAAGVWHSYTYANNGDKVFSPDIYETERVVYGAQMGIETLLNPQDMCFDAEGNLYILDAEQKSVVVVDRDFRLVSHITAFTKEGMESPLTNPTGLYADKQKRIYICDGGNQRIIRTDLTGKIDLEITKPQSDFFPEDVSFIPKKILMDSVGNLYVSAIGISDGLMLFDSSGKFSGFYGPPKVASTLEVLTDYFWRQFMSEEQKEIMASYVPAEVANFAITDEDFIVTVTNSYWNADGVTKMKMDDISLLNPKGIDVLQFDRSRNPGLAISEDAKRLNFVDVCTDSNGFMTFLDNKKGKIYQFDQRMNLIAAFGAAGSYSGTFGLPVSIAAFADKLYILDAEYGSVTVMRPTEYGKTIRYAITMYNTEKQSEVIEPWKEVLRLNVNYDLAYVGIGKVLLNRGEYREAMRYFELGHDSSQYNAAFRQLRLIFLRENLVLILVGIAVLLIGIKAVQIWRSRLFRRKERRG